MIIKQSWKHGYFLDLGRPNLFDEKDFEFWNKVHAYIKNADYNIGTNPAFYTIEEYLETGQKYVGGGFRYEFSFENYEDLKKFEEFMENMDKEYNFLRKEEKKEENFKEVASFPWCTLFAKRTEVGGLVFATDDIGGGQIILDTSTVDMDVLKFIVDNYKRIDIIFDKIKE